MSDLTSRDQGWGPPCMCCYGWLAVKKEHRSRVPTPAGWCASLLASTWVLVGEKKRSKGDPAASDSRRTASIDRRALAHTAMASTRRAGYYVYELVEGNFFYMVTHSTVRCKEGTICRVCTCAKQRAA